jgi:hypothetical protein
MISFFFYNKLTNPDLLSQINTVYEIFDGYINVKIHNTVDNSIEIDDDPVNNTIQLAGKNVSFDMRISDIIKKIHELEEIHSDNRTIFTLKSVLATNNLGETHVTNILF